MELPFLTPPGTTVVSASPRFFSCPESWGGEEDRYPLEGQQSNGGHPVLFSVTGPQTMPLPEPSPHRAVCPQLLLGDGAQAWAQRLTWGVSALSAGSVPRGPTELPAKVQMLSRNRTMGAPGPQLCTEDAHPTTWGNGSAEKR